jgi:transposase InsO family protein
MSFPSCEDARLRSSSSCGRSRSAPRSRETLDRARAVDHVRDRLQRPVRQPGRYVLVDRPGKVVALDTTVLPVMVRESVFGEPVKAHLTLALCAYTHSICAFRLTLVSDTSVDVAMLLRDVMLPLPMREDWGEEMEWPYPGLPASVVAEFAGHDVAGLPFFAPETVTTDHGSVYRNHHLVQVQEDLGCNILPSRVLRPQDKNLVERVFGSIRSLLFEWLPGYTGIDVADRGADPEGDAVLTMAELEHMIATWIVAVFTDRSAVDHCPDLRLLIDYMSATGSGGIPSCSFLACRTGIPRTNTRACAAGALGLLAGDFAPGSAALPMVVPHQGWGLFRRGSVAFQMTGTGAVTV